MPQTLAEPKARPAARGENYRRGLVAAGAVTALALGVAGLALGASATSAHRSLPVMALNVSSTPDWKLGGRGALVTDGRTTRILVELTRSSAAGQTPAMTGNFDGSGGGEPKVVTCTAGPRAWTVSPGKHQQISLTCNAVVPARVVTDMHYVWAGKQ